MLLRALTLPSYVLTKGLSDIHNSIGGMEDKLEGKIDQLEVTVKANEQRIEELTTVDINSTELNMLRKRVDRHQGDPFRQED